MQSQEQFRFGFEAEYVVARANNFQPLWYDELNCSELEAILDSIFIDDLPSLAGLAVKSPSGRVLPYYVEGYDQFDWRGNMQDVQPKGLEIRTPIAESPAAAVSLLAKLRERLAVAVMQEGMAIVPLSHHPSATKFKGARQHRTMERWKWAEEAMFNYAAHVNVSIPTELMQRLDLDQLSAKVNFYGPALTAISAASPIYAGRPWEIDGRQGMSRRIFRRCQVAPPFVYHEHQGHRLEFKAFDMSWRDNDFHAYLLLWLALILDQSLPGRSNHLEQVEAMRIAAIEGLGNNMLLRRATDLLQVALAVLPPAGFDVEPLASIENRVSNRRCPANEILDWMNDGFALEEVLAGIAVTPPLLAPISSASNAANTQLA